MIMLTIYTIFMMLVLFGLTIFVHELGHFLVARWCGLVVDAFSLGFGPAIFKREHKGTVYKIGVVPFGGYVALPQLDPGESPKTADGQPRPLPNIAPWRKILVAIAGVTGNMLFAVLLAYIVFWAGKPCVQSRVGFVDPESPAAEAGIQLGDDILTVDGEPIGGWDDFLLEAAFSEQVVLTVSNEVDGLREITVPTEDTDAGIRLVTGIGPVNFCSVGGVIEGSSAEAAGIQKDDVIVEFAGEKLLSQGHLIYLVDQHRDEPVIGVVDRGGEHIELTLTPKYDQEADRALIGIRFKALAVEYNGISHPTVSYQIRSHASQIFNILHHLTQRKTAKKMAGNIMGPVGILTVIWHMIQTKFMLALWFTGLLNVNLAILNILPIPVLDGGHIIVFIWEIITRRRASERVVVWLWNVFAALIIGLFVLLTVRDFTRLGNPFGGNGREDEKPAAVEAVPEPE